MAKQLINIGTSANKGDGDPLRTAFDKINDNFNELYASTSLDLDSIGSNMTPTTDGGFALGSATRQWSDLYVRDFIYIGGTRLQSDAAGNITVDGGSLQIKDVQGDIFADDSTKVFDSATQTFTGKFEGELIGTVAADDSTVLIDGVAGTINAGALTGNLPAIDGSALTGITASSIAFSNITSRPTTISGYGISDAYTKTEVDNAITSSVLPSGSAQSIDVVAADSTVLVDSVNGTLNATTLTGALPAINGSALTNITTTFANITSTPTTLAGYGITDALASGGALTGSSLDTNTIQTSSGNLAISADNYVQINSDNNGQIEIGTASGIGNVLIGNESNGTQISIQGEVFIEERARFFKGAEEKFATLTGQVGTVDHDCSNGHVFYHTGATGAITANFTNLDLTAEYATNLTIIINQGATAYEVNAVQIGGAVQTIEWQGGSAPTGTANGIDSFSFTILNDGGSYVVLGQMVDFT